MIISFTIENWISFRNKTTFSMVASRERRHGERVVKVPKFPLRILPVAAIYGANASGKTNFFNALNFIQEFVIKGRAPQTPIGVEPYRLDSISRDKPTRFSMELLIEEVVYEFSFAVTQKKVIEEKLVQITSSEAEEKMLYDRQGDTVEFDPILDKEPFLHFAFQGTQENQLFLANSVSQKVDNFRPVYDWFKNNLTLVATKSRPYIEIILNRS